MTKFALSIYYNKAFRKEKYMKEGFVNEYKFAQELDNKTYAKLSKNFKELLKSLYPNIKNDDKIECWVSRFNEKSDIKIRINGIIKGISIKMGEHNSVHLEHVDDFLTYLIKIGIDDNVIKKLKHFFSWTKRNTNKKYADYNQIYSKNIETINFALNDFYIKFKLFSRFLFQGNARFNYSAHAIIHGTPENFFWATRNEIIKYLLNVFNMSRATIKIGLLSLQIYEKDNKQFIQIKWHTMEKNLILITNSRELQSTLND